VAPVFGRHLQVTIVQLWVGNWAVDRDSETPISLTSSRSVLATGKSNVLNWLSERTRSRKLKELSAVVKRGESRET
jgi:hypothetical protein